MFLGFLIVIGGYRSRQDIISAIKLSDLGGSNERYQREDTDGRF